MYNSKKQEIQILVITVKLQCKDATFSHNKWIKILVLIAAQFQTNENISSKIIG